MKVGYVLKVFPRLSQTFILNELLAHERAGEPVAIFSLRSPRTEPRHRRLRELASSPQYLDLPRGAALTEGTIEAAAERLADSATRCDVGHLHAHFGNVATEVARRAATRLGCGYSFTAHARDIFHESVDRRALRRYLHDAAFVVTVSDFNRRYLIETYEIAPSRVVRIYNGIDLEPVTDPVAGGEARLLAVGRLVPKKGFGDFVEACRLLAARGSGIRARIVGDGPLRGELERRIVRSGLENRVVLCGALTGEAVVKEMRAATVLVAPCVEAADGDRDGLPTVLPEAMALGLPCVSTPVTGIPEIVRHRATGLLVAEHDPPALAEACRLLIERPDVATALARSARRLVEEQFDLHANAAVLRSLFRRATLARAAP